MEFNIHSPVSKVDIDAERENANKVVAMMDDKRRPWLLLMVVSGGLFILSGVMCSLAKVNYPKYLSIFNNIWIIAVALVVISLIYFIVRSDKYNAATSKRNLLKQISDDNLLKIQTWIECAEVAAYCEQVGQQGRKLVNGEYRMLLTHYDNYKKARELGEAEAAVYKRKVSV